jgi:hypothetical protein
MHFRVHLAPFFGQTPIQRIDARRIEAFAAHLRAKMGQGRRSGEPLSPKSIRNYLGTLSGCSSSPSERSGSRCRR